MIVRCGVTFLPFGGGQAFPFGEGSESKSREQEKGGKSTLNENCGFDCEQIADRLPNASRQLFIPGRDSFPAVYNPRRKSDTIRIDPHLVRYLSINFTSLYLTLFAVCIGNKI